MLNKTELMEQFVREYSNLVFTICHRLTGDYHESENLVQETFLSAYRSMDRMSLDNPKAYLTTIAANKCKDYLKSARVRRQSLMPEEDMGYMPASDDVEKMAMEHSVREKLRECCEKLKEPYREVALLRFVEERELSEIARLLERDVKTVATQAYRARDKLKPELKEWLKDESLR